MCTRRVRVPTELPFLHAAVAGWVATPETAAAAAARHLWKMPLLIAISVEEEEEEKEEEEEEAEEEEEEEEEEGEGLALATRPPASCSQKHFFSLRQEPDRPTMSR